jgi:hypothetical protein
MRFAPVHQWRCSTGLRRNQALTSADPKYLHPGPVCVTARLPGEEQPAAAATLTEIASNLEGVPLPSSTLTFSPENWYYVK